MKGAACVSLCCTKQSQAEHLSFHPSIWKIKKWSGGGRKAEREGGMLERERESIRAREACGIQKKKKNVLTHTGQRRAKSKTKKRQRGFENFCSLSAPHHKL